MTIKVGLTGGIGSGKSTVGRMLTELGALLVDADAIVHELQSPGTLMLEEIADVFGGDVIRSDGSLDREALGAIVFSDPEARAKLGQIVHPPVIAEMMRRTAEAIDAEHPMAVVDIPLLFEGAKRGQGAATLMDFDATLLAWVPQIIQLERTITRDGCTPEEARRRIDAQLHIDEKREMADHIVDNSGSLDETETQVRKLFALLTAGG